MRALGLAFLVGLVVLGIGVVIVNLTAIAAGSWWQARQPWIGTGLNTLVIGLGLVHVATPPLVLVVLAGRPARGWAVFGLLLVGIATPVALSAARMATMEVLVVTFLAWAVAGVVLTAWRRHPTKWLVAAAVVPIVGLSTIAASVWWLIAVVGLYARSRVPGSVPAPTGVLESAGTLLYSRPDLAMLMPGLPTFALVVMGLLALVAPLLAQRAGARVPGGQPVLT